MRSPSVRVFVPTYRRGRLLQRALASVRAQTFTDWICEVHNDDPADERPHELVAELADPRITCHRHACNLGGTRTFNLFFHGVKEPYFASLEDDNTWAPEFLATMVATAEQHPDVTVLWCNQTLSQEQADGEVRETGNCVHAYQAGEQAQRVAWPQPAQLFGAVHAHSAALFRSGVRNDFRTPEVPIALVEAFRERAFPHPLVFVPQPLAGFTITRQTARSRDHAEWAVLRTMLAATFVRHAAGDQEQVAKLWRYAADSRPPSTSILLLASMVEPSCRAFRTHARASDWLRLARSLVRRPAVLGRVLRSRHAHADWWRFLDRATAARFAELRHSA